MADSVTCHVVAIPYPGRGHINPIINLCNLISLRRPSDFLITVIVTEEWLGFIGSDPKPTNIRFATIPNVIPSELNRASDFPGFIKSVQTNLEDPVEKLLRRMEIPATVIIHDTYLMWMLDLGKRLDIPVASFFTMSATVFSMCYHHDLVLRHGHAGGDYFSEKGEEVIDYIPGVPPLRVADLVTGFNGKGKEVFPVALQAMLMADKARFLLFVSVYELEDKVIDALKSELSVPVYAIGPSIPYFNVQNDQNTLVRENDQITPKQNDKNIPDYMEWLNRQPEGLVLYVSQGSFLSVSHAQLEEIVAGVHQSGVRYVWVARGETSRFKRKNDERGLVVPWCDQLRVLCHGSVGAFWSHCGWNSTKEGAYAGVPMLTFPIFFDQVPNSKMIVEDWKIGRRVRVDEGILVTRDEIAKLIKSFMDEESEEGKEMRKRAREIKKICRQATDEGGSAQKDIDLFISDILNTRNINC